MLNKNTYKQILTIIKNFKSKIGFTKHNKRNVTIQNNHLYERSFVFVEVSAHAVYVVRLPLQTSAKHYYLKENCNENVSMLLNIISLRMQIIENKNV